MCGKKVEELFVKSPWGNIAVISWGEPTNPPVLLLHGYMDTAATFTFLVEKLPNNYHYVAVDIPGHGKSDPYPEGLLITKLHVIEVMRLVVDHMNWNTFIFVAHSMSCIMGLLYNAIYSNSIEKVIFLDPKPAFGWYYIIHYHTDVWYKAIYTVYYENYEAFNHSPYKTQPYESWVNAVARNRKLSRTQAEAVLSRSLIPTDGDTYRVSWENRAKNFAHVHLPVETLQALLKKSPPTLVVNASHYRKYFEMPGSRDFSENLLKDLERQQPLFYSVIVEGSHDCHITNPESVADVTEKFLKNNHGYFNKSKL